MPICFDLDGTLGHFGGGYILLRQALGAMWGAEPTPGDLLRCSGSTDWEILGQLHHMHLGRPMEEADYGRYEAACLKRFQETFHPEGHSPTVFPGLVEGLARLLDGGRAVWLISGNLPRVLDFKAEALGVDPRVRRLGSLPHLDREGLIRRAMEGCPGPHLYVGDRPHDRLAAERAGVPFIGVGPLVPGDHPVLDPTAPAAHLLEAVERVLGPAGPSAPRPGPPSPRGPAS